MSVETSMEDALCTYAEGPDRLEKALGGLSEADIGMQPPGKSGWAIRQMVHHLTEGDSMWTTYMKIAMVSSGSSFAADWYPGNNEWAERMNFEERQVAPALALFRANREYVVQGLRSVPAAWERSLIFKHSDDDETYRYTVGDIVALLTRHVNEHIDEINGIRQTLGR